MARSVGLRMSGPGPPVARGRERGSALRSPRPRDAGTALRRLAIAAGLLAGSLGPHAATLAAGHERCAGEGGHRLAGRLLGEATRGEVTPLAGQDIVLWPADAYRRAVAADLAAGGHPRPGRQLPPDV